MSHYESSKQLNHNPDGVATANLLIPISNLRTSGISVHSAMFSFEQVPWYYVTVDVRNMTDEEIAQKKADLYEIAVSQGGWQVPPTSLPISLFAPVSPVTETPSKGQMDELRKWLEENSEVLMPWNFPQTDANYSLGL